MRSCFIFLFTTLVLFQACRKEEFQEDGDFFYLKRSNATMPVWVKGNIASGVFIILLHGGPEGGSSQYYTIFPSHKKIEEQFAVVYWDQRLCGMSQGNSSAQEVGFNDFTTDLDQLITLLEHKYNHPKFFLMGHSWGGALGTGYLLEHQNRVKGWIEIDGGHSWTTSNAISRDTMRNYAAREIAAGRETEFWQFASEWYAQHPTIGINENAHYSFIARANGYDFNPQSDSLQVPFTDLLFYSPVSTAYLFVPYNFSFLNQGFDLRHRLGEITIPTLLCWGRHDKVFPEAIATDTYSRLGTPVQDKYLTLFEYSAHSPNYEEPEKFAHAVTEFVRQYAQ